VEYDASFKKWLSEFVDIDAGDRAYAEAMTMSGSKVEGTEYLGAEVLRVVVGRVLEICRHQNSDHLHICSVDVGNEKPLTIVTGAQNVRAGDLVPVALDGSLLPGGKEIRAGELRGVRSEGMLCSLKELGLTALDFPYAVEDGIFILREDCRPGDDIRPSSAWNDHVVEFEITSNRPDCLSVIGLARESAATFGKELRLCAPQVKAPEATSRSFSTLRLKRRTSAPAIPRGWFGM
jgi:phenylalanyl-tRNA synthetase beta chain